MISFEYDKNKSEANKLKHGIDFEEAKKLWKDEDAIEFPLHFEDEERFAAIGMIDKKLWTAILTCRNSNKRIISARRSRDKEKLKYESCKI